MPVATRGRSAVRTDSSDPGVLGAYPTLRVAARLLGVNVSTLSRRDDLESEARGHERRLPPRVVLDLARYYRRRSPLAVASDLVDYAYEQAPEYAGQVDAEVQACFDSVSHPTVEPSRFLDEARRTLPTELYEQVVSIYEAVGETAERVIVDETDGEVELRESARRKG